MLQREKFDRYVTAAEPEEFLVAFLERALFMKPTKRSAPAYLLRWFRFFEFTSEWQSYLYHSSEMLPIVSRIAFPPQYCRHYDSRQNF